MSSGSACNKINSTSADDSTRGQGSQQEREAPRDPPPPAAVGAGGTRAGPGVVANAAAIHSVQRDVSNSAG